MDLQIAHSPRCLISIRPGAGQPLARQAESVLVHHPEALCRCGTQALRAEATGLREAAATGAGRVQSNEFALKVQALTSAARRGTKMTPT